LKDDTKLLKKMKKIDNNIIDVRQYFKDTKNPICVISVKKEKSQKVIFEDLKPLFKHIKILVIVDEKNNDLDNLYMLLWRVVNNIDSNRDIFIDNHTIGIDATNKNELDNFTRRWPDDVVCTKYILDDLRIRGILDIKEEFIKKFGLL
jgi:4-hydroxy-3-polyprenylbenzoate decarboxylase